MRAVAQGKQSVGVARQWCGQLGKIENCQVGVFAALGRGTEATLIDERLFLPERWTADPKRCQAAGIPAERRGFKRKHDLALEMIAHARQHGIGFAWVGFDGFYGSDPAFLRTLDDPCREVANGGRHLRRRRAHSGSTWRMPNPSCRRPPPRAVVPRPAVKRKRRRCGSTAGCSSNPPRRGSA